MEHRVAPAGHPHEQPILARRRQPPERPVAQFVQRPADAVAAVGQRRHVVRPAAEVADAAAGERRDDGPAQAGNVGVHRGPRDRQSVFGRQTVRRVRPAPQLLGRGETREDVRVVRLQADRTLSHRLDELPPLVGARLLQVALDRPEPFDVPPEARLGRVRGCRRRQRHRVAQVLPLLALDLRLGIRVADVDVRVRQAGESPTREPAAASRSCRTPRVRPLPR